jgi:hypothetical protein
MNEKKTPPHLRVVGQASGESPPANLALPPFEAIEDENARRLLQVVAARGMIVQELAEWLATGHDNLLLAMTLLTQVVAAEPGTSAAGREKMIAVRAALDAHRGDLARRIEVTQALLGSKRG